MSSKIISVKKAAQIKGRVVLAGGCFDVLHPGHIVFLEEAKQAGDFLVVLLESDEKIRQKKGHSRPVHTQKDRAAILAALACVDFIVCLPVMKSDSSYDELIIRIKPDIIAATKGDREIAFKKRAAKNAGAKLVYVTKIVGDHSTSKILAVSGDNK